MDKTIDMAREAGILSEFDTAQDIIECGIEVWLSGERGVQTLERFAELIRADEREACARIAEEPSAATYECTVACGGPAQTFQQRFPKHSHDIAKEIRARGEIK